MARPTDDSTEADHPDPEAQSALPPAWLRRLVTEEGERLPVRDLTSRSRRTRPVGVLLAPATRRLMGRRGFAMAPLLEHWPEIMGPVLARQCIPVRLVMPRGHAGDSGRGGTLHLKAAAGAVATELTHRAPLLCERINTHLGFRAVESIRITQGVIPSGRSRGAPGSGGRVGARPPALPPRPPPAARVRALESALATVDDPDLRAALDRLGRAVLQRRPASGR